VSILSADVYVKLDHKQWKVEDTNSHITGNIFFLDGLVRQCLDWDAHFPRMSLSGTNLDYL